MAVRLISVIGGSVASAEDYSLALELGKLLADNDYTVICGGGTGVMEAVCRGTAENSGHSIGILPGVDAGEANRWVETVIVTGMGISRNRIIALSGNAVVAVGGRFGTLSEIAYALQADKPVCVMGRWASIEGVAKVESPKEALEYIIKNTGGD